MASLSTAHANRRSRRARVACEVCHERKVRCDGVANGFPCTNCRLDSKACTFRPSRRKRRPAPTEPAIQENPPDADSSPSPSRNALDAFSLHGFLSADEISQLPPASLGQLEAQGCLHIPGSAALESFVRHYFLYVQPCSPVVDEALFWEIYQRRDETQGRWSLLLFQAMLFTSASYVPVETARECGYESLLEARNDFYQKAKALYDAGIEKDSYVIAQTSLLLTYYSSPSTADTKWMSTAIQNAKAERAHQYHCEDIQTGRDKLALKRLWWSCIMRDRTLALAVRRPLQILPDEFDLRQPCLGESDLEDEIQQSEVYPPHVKAALCRVMISLCQLAIVVTDVLLIVYPNTRYQQRDQRDTNEKLGAIEQTKLRLLMWEQSCSMAMNVKDRPLHSSLVLYGHLLTMYYRSARMALCNHVCRLTGTLDFLSPSVHRQLERCKFELTEALSNVADSIRCLIMNGMADHLPITAVAHIVLPFVLLSINARRSSSIADRRRHEGSLIYFARIIRVYSVRYDTKHVSAMVQRAVRLSECASNESWSVTKCCPHEDRGQHRKPLAGIFDLRLSDYIQVLQYLDDSMATGRYADQYYHQTSSLCSAFSDPDLVTGEMTIVPWERPPTPSPAWLESMESFFFGSPGLSLSPSPLIKPSSLTIEAPPGRQDGGIFMKQPYPEIDEELLDPFGQIWADCPIIGE